MRRIYFFANFGDWNKLPLGGGEVGNRRTLDLFKKGGFEVVLMPKYLRVGKHSLYKSLLLMFRIVANIIFCFKILAFGRRNSSFVHVSGFYGQMIYFENVILFMARLFKYKVTYEMRGGGAEYFYTNGSYLYRHTFKSALLKADVVFTQGKENIPLIKKMNDKCRIVYYPNCVKVGFYPEIYPNKPENEIGLVYFGRISKFKHTDLVVDVYLQLRSRYPNIFLDLVGNSEDMEYLSYLKSKIENSGESENIRLLPACDQEQLKEILRNKLFYIFPSELPREGHSNALTEAMSWGLIPIATSQGFNRSVIGDDTLIVDELSPSRFADRISSVIESGKAESLSQAMYERVMKNFTEPIVYEKIIKNYIDLFDLYFPKY